MSIETTSSGPTLSNKPARRRRNRNTLKSLCVGVGWLATMAAIIGIYLGGAGIFMIVAGHVIPYSFVLTGIGLASVGYLTWFLGFGPGSRPPPTAGGAAPRRAAKIESPTVQKSLNASQRCSQCATVHRQSNRVVAMGAVRLCERCLSSAVAGLSSHWAVRTGLVPSEFDGYGPIRSDLRRARSNTAESDLGPTSDPG